MKLIKILSFLILVSGVVSCITEPEKKREVPVMGAEEVLVKNAAGEEVLDTIYKKIDQFSFIDQDSNVVDASVMAGNIYVVDFFFTSCPTICPKMKAQMLRVYEKFENEPTVKFLSHTIDTRHDSVKVLKAYADKLEIESSKWHMVTGEHDDIYGIADQYLVAASEDSTAPGGFIHGGAFILMDGNHHIRGYYDGTMAIDVDQLMLDIDVLLEDKK